MFNIQNEMTYDAFQCYLLWFRIFCKIILLLVLQISNFVSFVFLFLKLYSDFNTDILIHAQH